MTSPRPSSSIPTRLHTSKKNQTVIKNSQSPLSTACSRGAKVHACMRRVCALVPRRLPALQKQQKKTNGRKRATIPSDQFLPGSGRWRGGGGATPLVGGLGPWALPFSGVSWRPWWWWWCEWWGRRVNERDMPIPSIYFNRGGETMTPETILFLRCAGSLDFTRWFLVRKFI